MTVTETRPEPADAPTPSEEPRVDDAERLAALEPPAGLARLLATRDHRTIGLSYVLLALGLAVFALVVGALVGLERIRFPGIDIVGSRQGFLQLFGIYRVGLVFFVVIPLFIGIATYVVPLQLGANSIAFPRAAAAAFWTWLVGVGIHIAAVFAEGGLGSFTGTGSTDSVALTLLSLGMIVVALLTASVTVITTIVAFRPRGMSLNEVPLFAWSMLVACSVWLLSLPMFVANLVIPWVDLRGETSVLFGQGDQIYDQLRWLFEQPQVFAFAIPLLGVIAELIPVAFDTRQRHHGVMAAMIGLFGALSFGAWAQPYFNADIDQQVVYVAFGVIVVLPLLGLLGGWADTAMSRHRPALSAQLLLGLIGFASLFAGALLALLRVVGPGLGVIREADEDVLADFFNFMDRLRDSSLETGLMNYVLVAALMGGVAALHYWAPRLVGRKLNAGLGVLSGLVLGLGVALVAIPDVISAFLRQPGDAFRAAGYEQVDEVSAVEVLNTISAIGAFVLVVGVAVVVLNLVATLVLTQPTDEADPWSGQTLEWADESLALEPVHSAAPLLDRLEAEQTDEEAE